jgi:hypothetical protein
MIQTIRNLVFTLKSYSEIIKISISAIQMSLVLYLMYKLNRLKADMLDGIENGNHKMLNGIENVNSKVLNGLENVNSKVELLDLNFIKSIKDIKFKESNEVILKMLELQSKTAASSHLPVINIVNESSVKPVVIGTVILVVLTVSCIWWFSPKVWYITTTQLGKVNYIISELLRLIPGSNSAEATYFITRCNLKIVTTIDKGIPYLKVINHNDVSQGLEEFILQHAPHLVNAVSNVTEAVPTVVDVITKSGIVVTGLVA